MEMVKRRLILWKKFEFSINNVSTKSYVTDKNEISKKQVSATKNICSMEPFIPKPVIQNISN